MPTEAIHPPVLNVCITTGLPDKVLSKGWRNLWALQNEVCHTDLQGFFIIQWATNYPA
jgi:hypothetical protein